MSVTYSAMLPVPEDTVLFVSGLLHAQRRRLGTRAGTRSLGCYRQAILVPALVARRHPDRPVGRRQRVEPFDRIRLSARRPDRARRQAPSLHSALLAAKMAGYSHVTVDGTLIETDRCRTPGPTPGVDLWWSGKHDNHGGNVQFTTAPDGWPLWTSPVRPGREHDTTALRHHDEIRDYPTFG